MLKTVGPWGKEEREAINARFNDFGKSTAELVKLALPKDAKLAILKAESAKFEQRLRRLYENTEMTETQYMRYDSRLMDLKGAFEDCIINGTI